MKLSAVTVTILYLYSAAASHAVPVDAVPSEDILKGPFLERDVSAFHNPQKIFHPETWFHFIGGNVAAKGITADLEAIADANISGVQFFHGQFGGPWPGVEPQIKCLSESWDSSVHHVAGECDRLGLRFTMQNCPGWAMSGGPWITPEKAMRHLAWSRKDVTGGKEISVTLPRPEPSSEEWRDYRDITVLAFPVPDGDTGEPLVPVAIKSNREDQPWEKCLKGDEKAKIKLEPDGKPTWVEVKFQEPVTLRTLELPSVRSCNHRWSYSPDITITVEAILPDGPEKAAEYQMPQSNWQDRRPISLACSDARSDTYRITIDNKHKMGFGFMQFFSGARKNNWQGEAGWVLRGLMREPHPKQSEDAWLNPEKVLVLKKHMDPEGKLTWDAPEGNWTILRFGHVNTGKRNKPAPPEATGWECDKLSPTGAEAHFPGYIGRIAGDNGPAAKGLLKGMLLDSWECETQTWTPGMDKLFKKHNSYPLTMWLPALAGYVVSDPETTARFLCDWRSTLNDLLVRNYFGRMAELGHEQGLAISFETASGDVFPADILEYYKHADVPMCEFWHPRMESFVGSFEFKPVKPCVSAARLYGKPRVAAEAFTSFALSWTEHPGMLKNIGDMHFAEGVTHLVFHTYTHNPRTDFLPPGTSFGARIGTPFLRGQTWWKYMPEFTGYIARCGYLLERGRPVSDVLWYLGDETGHKPSQNAPFPAGYKYDYCNPDILLNKLSVKDGRIVTPEGLSYRVLLLRNCERMLPETLERMADLVRAGAVVVGGPPVTPATLKGGNKTGKRFNKAVKRLWGEASEQKFGKGRVVSGKGLAEVLKDINVQPDVTGDGVSWLHRQTAGSDWYFITTPAEHGFHGTLGFRATGNVELWDPLTGSVKKAGVVRHDTENTMVALDLPPSGSVFVVFRKSKDIAPSIVRVEHDGNILMDAAAPRKLEPVSNISSSAVPACEIMDNSLIAWRKGEYRAAYQDGESATVETASPRDINIGGPWSLAFPGGWGAPEKLKVDKLDSWTELELSPEAKAFSGTVVYTTEFSVDKLNENSAVKLDLGSVNVIAEVYINDKPAGTLWTTPYRLDVTDIVKPGKNKLTVKVTNTWFNRLAYDANLPEDERKTWTISGPKKGSTLKPAGLLGPVILHVGERLKLTKKEISIPSTQSIRGND